MKISFFKICMIACFMLTIGNSFAQQQKKPIWQSKEYAVFGDRIIQDNKYVAKALSPTELTSGYQSSDDARKDKNPSKENLIASYWVMSKDASAFPQYKSDYLISDAIYNMSLEEMIKAVEPDSTFRTGKE